MKKPFFVNVLINLSLYPIFTLAIGFSQPAASQVFRCNDTNLGSDSRQGVTGNNSKTESTVVTGQDCSNANFQEAIIEQQREFRRRALEADEALQKRLEQDARDRLRSQQEFQNFILRDQGKDEAQKKQTMEYNLNQELMQQRRAQDARREYDLKETVRSAKSQVERLESDIDRPVFPERKIAAERKLPEAKKDLQIAEQELRDFWNSRSK